MQLSKHVSLAHKDQKPEGEYKCSVCSLSYGRMSHLKRHVKISHPTLGQNDFVVRGKPKRNTKRKKKEETESEDEKLFKSKSDSESDSDKPIKHVSRRSVTEEIGNIISNPY